MAADRGGTGVKQAATGPGERRTATEASEVSGVDEGPVTSR